MKTKFEIQNPMTDNGTTWGVHADTERGIVRFLNPNNCITATAELNEEGTIEVGGRSICRALERGDAEHLTETLSGIAALALDAAAATAHQDW